MQNEITLRRELLKTFTNFLVKNYIITLIFPSYIFVLSWRIFIGWKRALREIYGNNGIWKLEKAERSFFLIVIPFRFCFVHVVFLELFRNYLFLNRTNENIEFKYLAESSWLVKKKKKKYSNRERNILKRWTYWPKLHQKWFCDCILVSSIRVARNKEFIIRKGKNKSKLEIKGCWKGSNFKTKKLVIFHEKYSIKSINIF